MKYDANIIMNSTDFPLTPLRKPLMIGCSGGTGHNSAIEGIATSIRGSEASAKTIFVDYQPVKAEDRVASKESKQIYMGISVMHAPVFGYAVQSVVDRTQYPVLPTKAEIEQEVTSLSSKQKPTRTYIDMLLDVYPGGFESAAIWNVLQKQDETATLRKLIALQENSDTDNYQTVRKHFYDQLVAAAEKKEPFTEVMSTQAMSLPALCDAVAEYNTWCETQRLTAPRVFVHQYMTDLATKGAVHFFNPLSRLTPSQQEQMQLFGVNCDSKIMDHFFPKSPSHDKGHYFNKVEAVDSAENPMVRAGFKDPQYDNSEKFSKEVQLTFKDAKGTIQDENKHTIQADEKIASIMLGGQGGNDSYKYIENLLQTGCEKVFVFGVQNNQTVQAAIQQLIDSNPHYQGKIISLANQDAEQIAALMSRSNVVVTRGGGLSVMEQMAMKHSQEQSIFIHHADSEAHELTSGISWEDANVDALIEHLTTKEVYSKKTSPALALRHFREMELIHSIPIQDAPYKATISDYIQNLSQEEFDAFFSDAKDSKSSRILGNITDQVNADIVALEAQVLRHKQFCFNNIVKALSSSVKISTEHDLKTWLSGNINQSIPHSLSKYLEDYDAILKLNLILHPPDSSSPFGTIGALTLAMQDQDIKKLLDHIEGEQIKAPANKILHYIQRMKALFLFFFHHKSKIQEESFSSLMKSKDTKGQPMHFSRGSQPQSLIRSSVEPRTEIGNVAKQKRTQ